MASGGSFAADERPITEVRIGQLPAANSLTIQSLDDDGGTLREPLAKIGAKVVWAGPFASYPAASEAAKSGKIDITSSGFASLVNEAKVKSDILLFAIESNHLGEGIVVRGDSGIKTIEDLKGKKIAVNFPGGTGEYILFRTLEENGISREGINRININNPEDGVAAFASGDVDAIATWDQYLASAINVPGALLLVDGKQIKSLNSWVHFVTRDFATKHPEAVKAVFDGLVAAAAKINADPSIDSAAYKRQGAPTKIIQTISSWNLKPRIIPIDAEGLKLVQQIARQTYAYGFQPQLIDVTNNVFDVTKVK
nr:NrtA/SsuA/CpmA family ABC transporter substrate-binding protein [Bradyrhizobium sp. dw_78]